MEVLVTHSFHHKSCKGACDTRAAEYLAGRHAQSCIRLNKSVVSPEHWKLPVTARPHVQVTCWAGTVGCDTSVHTPVGAALPCQANDTESAEQAEQRSASNQQARQKMPQASCRNYVSLAASVETVYGCRDCVHEGGPASCSVTSAPLTMCTLLSCCL